MEKTQKYEVLRMLQRENEYILSMDYAEGMTSSDLTIMALCRPVDTLFENKDGYETSVLLNFTSGSGTVNLGHTEITADQITGDLIGMVLSTHSWYG